VRVDVLIKAKFLHCGDIHLDRPFVGLDFTPEKSKKRREELLECFSKICEIGKEEKVDTLLIAGDLYENKYISRGTVDFLKKKFKSLDPIPVLICGGNHDPILNNWVYHELERLPNVFFFGEGRKYQHPQKNLVVYGQGFTDFYKDHFETHWIDERDQEKINIFMTHASLDIDLGNHKYNPLRSAQLKSLDMDYIALGHFHNRFEVDGKDPFIFNPGSPEPLGFDEVGDHGVYMVHMQKEAGKVERQVQFLKTNKRTYQKIWVDVSGCAKEEECIRKITKNIENFSKDDFIGIILEGFLDRGFEMDKDKLKAYLDEFFYVTIKDHTMIDISFKDLVDDSTIKGEYVRNMLQHINKSSDEDTRKNLLSALYIGLEVLMKGTVDVERYFRS
jgi:DNA repair protein SbcD/Mre11